MGTGVVYRKTELGRAEVGARRLKLNPRVRTMLILIDGAQDELKVRDEAEKVGAPRNFLDELIRLGLVEQIRANAMASAPANSPHAGDEDERFRAARKFMNVTLGAALGSSASSLMTKVERARTLADLRELAGDYEEAIGRSSNPADAEVLVERVGQLLAGT